MRIKGLSFLINSVADYLSNAVESDLSRLLEQTFPILSRHARSQNQSNPNAITRKVPILDYASSIHRFFAFACICLDISQIPAMTTLAKPCYLASGGRTARHFCPYTNQGIYFIIYTKT